MTFEPKRSQEGAPALAATAPRSSSGSMFASLTADLLARKGEAKPALEPFAHARVAPGSAREMSRGERHDIDRPERDEHDRDLREQEHLQEPRNQAQEVAAQPEERASSEFFKDKVRFTGLMNAIAARAGGLAPSSFSRVPQSAPKQESEEAREGACTDNGEPCPRKADAAKRAAVAVRFTTHDFLRLRLAAAELETPAHDIIVAALNTYLDEKGVERFDECLCLRKAADKCEEIASGTEDRD